MLPVTNTCIFRVAKYVALLVSRSTHRRPSRWGAGVLAIALGVVLPVTSAVAAETVAIPWYERLYGRINTTWNEGQPELYLPLHTTHLRFAYSSETISRYNETPWGIGIGKAIYDEDGDWHGLFLMEFKDSHFKPEYAAGYGYRAIWSPAGELKFGLGYNAFLTARSDIGHYVPIPLILPAVSLGYKKITVDTTYVPGRKGAGNVLFFYSHISF